jgi:MFS transporter, DHA1 family, multidrug resistance protein
MKNRNINILFFTLTVVMLGFGIVIPLLPFLVERFGGNGTSMGVLMAIYSVMQFAFSPIWGTLSDRFGRKPILILGIAGNALTQIMFGLAGSLTTLFIARALAGVLSSATLPTAMAYISDSTEEHERGGGMGVVGAAMGVGMVLGPGLGGLMGKYSLSAPFYFAAAVSVVAMALVWFLLPESLHEEHRTSGVVKIQGPKIADMVKSLASPIGFLLILAFLHSFALANFEGVFGMYAQLRYDYDEATIGLVLTIVGVVSAIAQGALTGLATKRWGDALVIKVSLFASIFGFALMLVATNLLTVILMTGLFVFTNSMIRPGVSALISKRSPYGQGMAMGMNNAYMSLGRIFGPLWAGAALDINLGFPYMTGAFIMLVGFIASLFFLPHRTTAPNAAEPAETV